MDTIILSYGDWRALVVPDCAMNVISLTYADEEVLNSPPSPETLLTDPFIYGIPLLFPPNRLQDDAFEFRGRRYSIPYKGEGKFSHIHGCLTNAPAIIEYLSQNELRGRIRCGKDRYPFECEIAVECTLSDEGLLLKHTVINTGNVDMPFAIGFHTTFAARAELTVSVGEEWQLDGVSRLPVKTAQLDDSGKRLLSGIDPSLCALDGQFTDNGSHTATLGSYCYKLSDNFSDWVIWNMGGRRGFVSVEPQSAPVNGLNMEGKYCILGPGESEVYCTVISRNK